MVRTIIFLAATEPPEFGVDAFWSAISQVVPVIALALVLETRVLARSWGQNERPLSLRARLAWALILTLLWCGLLAAEIIALVALAFGIESLGLRWFAICLTTFGVGVVVAAPISSVVSAALRDVFFRLRKVLPWSLHHRLLRRVASSRNASLASRSEGHQLKIEILRLKLSFYAPHIVFADQFEVVVERAVQDAQRRFGDAVTAVEVEGIVRPLLKQSSLQDEDDFPQRLADVQEKLTGVSYVLTAVEHRLAWSIDVARRIDGVVTPTELNEVEAEVVQMLRTKPSRVDADRLNTFVRDQLRQRAAAWS